MDNIFNLGNNNFQIKANAVFQTLDAKDKGGADGRIEASIWNEFADKVGGKHINQYITQQNAVKSINAYIKRGGEIVKQAIYDYLGWSTDKAHERINNAKKMLEDVAKGTSQVTIRIAQDKKTGEIVKEATLSDGRYIIASYDKQGNIESIVVSTETGQATETSQNGQLNDDATEVMFRKDDIQVDAETNTQRNHKYDLKVTEGYEFEKYKALADKIFGSHSDKNEQS